jgi:glutamine amidotransferase
MAVQKTVIVDIGIGNLYSVSRAIKQCGSESQITTDPHAVLAADKIILPGVGAFGKAIKKIKSLGLDQALLEAAENGKPMLGICLGMQLLFEQSDEFGHNQGLGIIPGKVVRFPESFQSDNGARFKVPQIGWNNIRPPEDSSWQSTLLDDVAPGSWFYFVHAYFCQPADRNFILGLTDYAQITYCSVVRKDQIWGCQFHPERSSEAGLSIYQKFLTKEY